MLKWLWLSALVIVLDQFSKYLISGSMQLWQSIEIAPFFNLTLLHNTGAAFSFLSGAGGWQRWFFTVIALAVSAVIILWLKRLPAADKWQAAALSLILGGALGNVIDRVRFGYVVDFLDFHYRQWHWPAFNVADSAITAGVAVLAVVILGESKRPA
ncbi:MAG: lipoprotein signal peptidase [Gammaproteobacteria bacterium]|nr:MAG: lipoprotein signal peptidase [Gammaproteobacteria bacterium]